MIKAVFLDIDGTMLSFETHRVPDNTRMALQEARNRGIKIFVSTGRHGSDIINLDGLEFDGYITLNGAYCWIGDQVIFKKHIPHEDLAAFIHYDEAVKPVPCFFVEADHVFANREDALVTQMMELVEFTPRPVVPSHEFLGKEIFQLTAFFPDEDESTVMQHLPGCGVTRWYPTFADIVARDIDKSVGLERIGACFGFNRDEMMAIGDGGNDISMIQYAGIGIAMGNADENVKRIADYVTASVDDDGIGKAFRKFGII
jgi:Cof subfamily protein (haloacid dehalogenase superfamily)